MRSAGLLLISLAFSLLSLASGRLLAAEADDHAAFLDRIVNEVRAIRQAEALHDRYSPRRQRSSRLEMLLDEERLRRRVRSLPVPRPSPRKVDAPPHPPADLEKAARELAAAERRRKEEIHSARVGRRMTAVREHIASGRLAAAEQALKTVLRMDPPNREAARLLIEVRRDAANLNAELTARERESQTAAAMRGVDRLRVPHAKTLTLPRDWAERAAARAGKGVRLAAGQAGADRVAVETALGKKVSIDAAEMPVSDVAAYFRHVGGVNIVVEKNAADRQVTVRLRDVRLADALGWVTRLTGLAYTIRGGCIHIGTRDQVREKSVLRIYDVSDILHVRRALSRGRQMRRALRAGAIIDPDDRAEPWEEVEVKSLRELAEDLMDFLRTATGKHRWGPDADQARMDFRLGRLVVNAEPALQAKLLSIIEHVRP